MKLFGIEIRKTTRYKQGTIEKTIKPKGPPKIMIFGRSFKISDIILGFIFSLISVVVVSAFFILIVFYKALTHKVKKDA